MKVREFLKSVYTKVQQAGAGAIVNDDWLPLINESLWQFFDYKGYTWLRQMTIEEIPATQFKNGNMFEIQTAFPILDIHRFFQIPTEACTDWIENCEPLAEMKTWKDKCGCGMLFASNVGYVPPYDYYVWPHVAEDGTIDMEHRKPKSTLCPGTFAILNGQWGYYLRGQLPTSFRDSYKVYTEYKRGFNKIVSYDEDIQIPDNLTPSLSHLITSKLIDSMGQFRSGDGSYHYSMFERSMDMAYENQPQTIQVLKMMGY